MARGKRGRFVKARGRGRRAARTLRRAGGRVRRFIARRLRGRSLGLVGKTGVGIAAGSPILFSALDGASTAIAAMRSQNLGLLGTVHYAAARFINGVTKGFGSGPVFDVITVYDQQGGQINVNPGTAIPGGAWFKTAVAGGILVAWDIAVSWASHKFAKVRSGVRFMGQKLTGGT